MTRIAFYVNSLAGGGAERSIVNLLVYLVEHGHAVDLIVNEPRGELLEHVPESVQRVVCEAGSRHLALGTLLGTRPAVFAPLLVRRPERFLKYVLGLRRYLDERAPDALISALHGCNEAAIAASMLARRRPRTLVVVRNTLSAEIRLNPKLARKHLWAIQYLFPLADRIVAVSEGVATDLVRTAGVPAERLTTIYNPVIQADVAELRHAPVAHPWFAPGSPPVILAAGRLVPAKNFPLLVRTFARLRNVREARLVILGQGPQEGALRSLARELGVYSDVDLPGFQTNPFAYMSRAAVLVLSSEHEGLPGVLIQALACGCPVVSTDCPSGPREILEDGRYGRLVPVGDEEALAQAILETLDEEPDRERLRARAAEFSVEKAARAYLELIERITSEERRA